MAPLSTAQLDEVDKAVANKIFNKVLNKMKELLQHYHTKLVDAAAKKVTINLLERGPDTQLEQGHDAVPTYDSPPLQSCATKSKEPPTQKTNTVVEGVLLAKTEKQHGEIERETVMGVTFGRNYKILTV